MTKFNDDNPAVPPVASPGEIKPVLEASAVVAHHVSRDTAERTVRQVAFRVTLREVLISLVLTLALIGVIGYFENQHSADQQRLKDRRSFVDTRVVDLQNQINELQRFVEQLRAGLLKAGVQPGDIPTIPSAP